MESSDFYCVNPRRLTRAILRDDRLGSRPQGEVEIEKVRKSRETPIGMMCRRQHRATVQPVI